MMAADEANEAPPNGGADKANGEAKDSRTLYIEQLRAEAAVHPQVPDLEVKFDFSYGLTVPVSQADYEIHTTLGKLRDLLLTPVSLARSAARLASRAPDTSTRRVTLLDGCRGALRPGSLTLLLSPPGHGKTTLLKALAGLVPPAAVEGNGITYNGLTAQQLAAQGTQLKLLANYVDQLDTHLPFLTVRETAEFACLNSTVEPAVMGDAMLTREAAHRVDRVLKLLHLEGCADTLVGNDLVRGVSGGEKKRVTVAEALVSNARLFCMDEISTGLDASVTYDIVASIRAWAHEMRGTVIVALLQPTPEVYDLFDDVMLLREGSVVYHGPRTELPGYLAALGFTPPGAADEASSDMADWLVELLASPGAVLKRQRASGRSAAQLAYSASTDALLASNASTASLGSVWDEDVPRTTAALAAAWAGSAICAARMAAPAPEGVVLESAFAKRQYGHASPRSGVTHFRALLARQFRITARNSLFVTARMVSAIVISIILGTFWYDLSMSQGLTKFGMLLFSVLQLGFANMGELPYAVENKYVGYKHMSSGMYPAWAYSLAASLVQLPVAAVETAAFSVILYFMVGLVNDGGRWAMFYLIALLVNLVVGSLFRLIAYMVPTAEAAQTAPGPFIALQVIFAGFLVAPSHMGSMVNGTPWLLFMYYATMFAYPLRSLAHNEFLSPPYDIYPSNATGAIGPSASLAAASSAVPITEFGSPVLSMYYPAATCDALPALDCGLESYGVQTLRKLNIDLEPGWKWGGVGFLLGMVVLLNVAAAFALSAVRITRNVGSSRAADEHEPAAAGKDGAPLPAPAQERAVVDVAPAGSAASVLPFQPMTVSWRDVKYTVQLNKNLGGGAKTLLQGVSGIAQPGRLIALMGASGAGKSTLLDVIAGRKTAGAMEGGIFLNGFAREEKSFARLTAYCEQQDIHNSFATVREALAFSAALRLPRDVDAATRDAFVEEVVDMLKLRYIAHRMVGEVGAANGLSPGQRKILTMGVELVSNAPILFLDEPTSGLDAQAASLVIRAVRNIAHTKRTVICTVHQPSLDVFAKFDDVLLLQRGGWMAYFGALGPRSRTMVAYVESIPGARECPHTMNPASWMLDVLSGADSSGGHAQSGGKAAAGGEATGGAPLEGLMLQETLFASASWAASRAAIDAASVPVPGATPYAFPSVYARTFPEQLRAVLARVMISHNRNHGFTYTKTLVLWSLLILFGTIWYKILPTVECAPATGTDTYACGNDVGGVQSITSVVFLSVLFTSVIAMNTLIPVMIRERAVFYRERFSRMYAPEAHALAYAIAEIPWMVGIVLLTFTGFYFMVGFPSGPAEYWFFHLVVCLVCLIFTSLGQWSAAYFPTTEVAQAFAGLLIPLAFLFGGLYLPKPQIPDGEANGHPHIYWLWAFYLDPLSYALEALLPGLFVDKSRPSNVDHMLALNVGSQVVHVDSYTYVTQVYDVSYDKRWRDVGLLAVFIGGLQLFHLYATRFKSHINR